MHFKSIVQLTTELTIASYKMNIKFLNIFLLLNVNSINFLNNVTTCYHLTNIINSLSMDRIQFVPFFVAKNPNSNKISDITEETLQNIRKDISVMVSSANFEFIEFANEHKAFVKVILFDHLKKV